MVLIKSYKPEKICQIPQKGETTPKTQVIVKIIPPNSAYETTLLQKFKAPIYKNVEFCIFHEKQDHGRELVFLFLLVCLFSKRRLYQTSCPRRSGEGSFHQKSKVLTLFLSDPPPQILGEGLQSMNFAHCLHALAIGKYTDIFRGRGLLGI